MSHHGNVTWGKVLKGAAIVTAITAACIFLSPFLPTAITGTSAFIGEAVTGLGTGITGIGSWIAGGIKTIAGFGEAGALAKAATLTTAAIAGGVGMALATKFTDRVNNTAEAVGVDTGRQK